MRLTAVTATESQEQRALVKWIRLQPWYCEGDLIKINNEGKRSEGQKWNLIHMGMCIGAADLFLAYPSGSFSGLWMEVKRVRGCYPRGIIRSPHLEAQERFLLGRKKQGFAGTFVFGWEHGRKVVEKYLSGCDIDLWELSKPLLVRPGPMIDGSPLMEEKNVRV